MKNRRDVPGECDLPGLLCSGLSRHGDDASTRGQQRDAGRANDPRTLDDFHVSLQPAATGLAALRGQDPPPPDVKKATGCKGFLKRADVVQRSFHSTIATHTESISVRMPARVVSARNNSSAVRKNARGRSAIGYTFHSRERSSSVTGRQCAHVNRATSCAPAPSAIRNNSARRRGNGSRSVCGCCAESGSHRPAHSQGNRRPRATACSRFTSA